VFALIGFGIAGGFLYYLAIVVAFENLPTEVASTIAMAETPAVVIVVHHYGEMLTPLQVLGIAIALGATAVLSITEARQKPTA